jgi:hypothetical protein
MEKNIIGLLIILALVFFFIEILLYLNRKRRPRGTAPGKLPQKIIADVKEVSFEDRVIAALQTQTGCWGKPGKELIEVYKNDKLVGIVKCCEDGWAVTPSLVNEIAVRRVWYHVKIAYIASQGAIPAEARRVADEKKVRLLRIPE